MCVICMCDVCMYVCVASRMLHVPVQVGRAGLYPSVGYDIAGFLYTLIDIEQRVLRSPSDITVKGPRRTNPDMMRFPVHTHISI